MADCTGVCETCPAECDYDDPDPMSAAEVQYWVERRLHEHSRLLGSPGEPTANGWCDRWADDGGRN